MKLLKQLLTATTVTTCLFAASPAKASVEISYSASQIQCGRNAPQIVIGVDVFDNGQLVAEDLRVNESVLVSSLENVTLDYNIVANGGSCRLARPSEVVVSNDSEVPNLRGAFEQDSILDLLAELEDYEDLFLVELGTTNKWSRAYDLQDVVFIVNNEPFFSD